MNELYFGFRRHTPAGLLMRWWQSNWANDQFDILTAAEFEKRKEAAATLKLLVRDLDLDDIRAEQK